MAVNNCRTSETFFPSRRGFRETVETVPGKNFWDRRGIFQREIPAEASEQPAVPEVFAPVLYSAAWGRAGILEGFPKPEAGEVLSVLPDVSALFSVSEASPL